LSAMSHNISNSNNKDTSLQTPNSSKINIKNQEFRFEEYRYKDFK